MESRDFLAGDKVHIVLPDTDIVANGEWTVEAPAGTGWVFVALRDGDDPTIVHRSCRAKTSHLRHVETEDEREARLDDEAAPWRVVSLYAGLGTSVLTFRCEDPKGVDHLVGVDHRCSQDILEALSDPEQPPVYIDRPASWQILRSGPVQS